MNSNSFQFPTTSFLDLFQSSVVDMKTIPLLDPLEGANLNH
jgi:hypothetical protein